MMMMQDMYIPSALSASLCNLGNDDMDMIMEKRRELDRIREESTAAKLKKDTEKMKKQDSFNVKVGLMIPAKTAEQQITRDLQWLEEERKRREELQAMHAEKEAQYLADLETLRQTEEVLADLQNQLQAKKDEIRLEESELTAIQKEFEDKLQMEVRSRMGQSSSPSSSKGPVLNHRETRMREEAERRAVKKALRNGAVDPEQVARNKLLQNIEEKEQLEKDIVRVSKDVGLQKQRIRLKELSREQIMTAEAKRRIEAGPHEMPTLEELYAPKVVPPRPVILKAHVSRMEAAKAEREARRAARLAATPSNVASSSSSSSSSKVGESKN